MLVATDLQEQVTTGPQQPSRVDDDPAHHIESVGPAVERHARLVGLHVRRQEGQRAGRDVRRHRGHDIPGVVPTDGVGEVTHEGRDAVGTGAGRGAWIAVDAHHGGARVVHGQHRRDRTGARTEVEGAAAWGKHSHARAARSSECGRGT